MTHSFLNDSFTSQNLAEIFMFSLAWELNESQVLPHKIAGIYIIQPFIHIYFWKKKENLLTNMPLIGVILGKKVVGLFLTNIKQRKSKMLPCLFSSVIYASTDQTWVFSSPLTCIKWNKVKREISEKFLKFVQTNIKSCLMIKLWLLFPRRIEWDKQQEKSFKKECW